MPISISECRIPLIKSTPQPEYILKLDRQFPAASIREEVHAGRYLNLYPMGRHSLVECVNPYAYNPVRTNTVGWVLPEYTVETGSVAMWQGMLADLDFMTGFDSYIDDRRDGNYVFLHLAKQPTGVKVPYGVDRNIIQSVLIPHVHTVPRGRPVSEAAPTWLTDKDTLTRLVNRGGEVSIARFYDLVEQILGEAGTAMEYKQQVLTPSGQATIERTIFGYGNNAQAIEACLRMQSAIPQEEWLDWARELHGMYPFTRQSQSPNMAISWPSEQDKVSGGLGGDTSRVWVVPFPTICPLHLLEQYPQYPDRYR